MSEGENNHSKKVDIYLPIVPEMQPFPWLYFMQPLYPMYSTTLPQQISPSNWPQNAQIW